MTELRDPSDDSLHTSAAGGSRTSTAPTTPVRNKDLNEIGEDDYEDIAKHKIIQVAGTYIYRIVVRHFGKLVGR